MPGTTIRSALGIAAATVSDSSRIDSFEITSAGTRIAGRMSVTSRSICIRRKSAHAAGLDVSRWCQTNQST
jgi:hypothetical protein